MICRAVLPPCRTNHGIGTRDKADDNLSGPTVIWSGPPLYFAKVISMIRGARASLEIALSLPVQPEVARAAAERIAQAIREFISK